MLVKQGFNVDIGRIINPTAVFCNSRDEYYSALSKADSGKKNELLNWCEYVLSGLKTEIEKVDNLLDYNFLKSKILIPSIRYSLERKYITEIEEKILTLAVEKQLFKAADIKQIFPKKLSAEISRLLRRLKDKKMIISEKNNPRKYIISFTNNFLLRSVIYSLDKNGFLPITNK
jgi:Fic family protein